MNIALYGGSFDPPHLGHIRVVHTALKTLDIDKVIVVPAFLNPFKSGTHAPAELRLKWLQEIFSDDKNVEVSDIEVRQNRAVRSITTVKKFATEYEKIYFIIGADNLASLEQWYQFDELNTLVTWVVATRDKIKIPDTYIQLAVEQPISSSELREQIEDEHLPKKVADSIKTYYEEKHARSY
ncbi:MAG: nicotinate (nicotinamide) nucleotide adenylyltransferase [Helicobacteraceae bacterium]|jgi:nicotinate-nucleotide adenylyltransferase|nr:nicotinate (nicotinamide) nucleotide adenylyltransferase [Helicobacteraceae bacterium]